MLKDDAVVSLSCISLPFVCFFPGWGRTVGGGSAADILQQAILPTAAHRTCYRKNKVLGRVDEDSMLCAGGQGKGGCQVRINKLLHGLKFIVIYLRVGGG